MSLIKWGVVLLLLAALAVVAVLFVVTRVEIHQAREAASRFGQLSHQADAGSRIAVVYFSRSGNTAIAATHVARRLGARLFRLEAPDYELGMKGIVNALGDTRRHEARVSPANLDLRDYQTVYLGSPVWLYSPAPPIWEFARRHRFDGKDVVLFNTFNSKFEDRFIEDFRKFVMAQGARSFQHRFVKRGRMGRQLSPDEMLKAIDAEWTLIDQPESLAK